MNIIQEAAERQINDKLTCGEAAATPRGRKTELNLKLMFITSIKKRY